MDPKDIGELVAMLRREIANLTKRIVALEYMLGERIVDDGPEILRPHKCKVSPPCAE